MSSFQSSRKLYFPIFKSLYRSLRWNKFNSSTCGITRNLIVIAISRLISKQIKFHIVSCTHREIFSESCFGGIVNLRISIFRNGNDTFQRGIGILVNWHISTRVLWREDSSRQNAPFEMCQFTRIPMPRCEFFFIPKITQINDTVHRGIGYPSNVTHFNTSILTIG